VRVALALAADADGIARLRATLRARLRASPLMDEAGFARDVESAYRALWRDGCERRLA
jgi:predicted O-linked N-acetylglucosamine transferase (SPINDLY family)